MSDPIAEGEPAHVPPGEGRHVSAAELAARSGTSIDRIEELVVVGLLDRGEPGYRPGDIQRVRVIEAFVAAGVPLMTLAGATADGRISLDYYGDLHAEVGDLAGSTYGDLRRDTPVPDLLPALFAALGLAEPESETPLSAADAELVQRLLDILGASPDHALMLRVVRLIAEAARRATTGALDVYAERVSRDPALAGLPSNSAFEKVLSWSRLARTVPDLAGWLTAQHLSRALEAYHVEATERQLGALGLLPPISEVPPGVAFVDLSGFTLLTEARGDEAAAAIALRLGELATETAERHQGRVVKLLGDGVLMLYRHPADAVAASLDLLAVLAADGLPAGHAGIHAGPVVARDGDVFGRTVNLAARLADAATDGELLVSDAVLTNLAGPVSVEEAGQRTLQGIGEMTVYRVTALS